MVNIGNKPSFKVAVIDGIKHRIIRLLDCEFVAVANWSSPRPPFLVWWIQLGKSLASRCTSWMLQGTQWWHGGDRNMWRSELLQIIKCVKIWSFLGLPYLAVDSCWFITSSFSKSEMHTGSKSAIEAMSKQGGIFGFACRWSLYGPGLSIISLAWYAVHDVNFTSTPPSRVMASHMAQQPATALAPLRGVFGPTWYAAQLGLWSF